MIAEKKKNKKESLQTITFSVLIGILTIGVIGFLVYSNLKMGDKRAKMLERIDELKEEVRLMEERNAVLSGQISDAASDSYWEEKAREQGYEKEGEQTVVVIPSDKEEAMDEEEVKGFWDRAKERLGF